MLILLCIKSIGNSHNELNTFASTAKMKESQPSLVFSTLGRPRALLKTELARNMVTMWTGCEAGLEPFIFCLNTSNQKPSDSINTSNGGFNVK